MSCAPRGRARPRPGSTGRSPCRRACAPTRRRSRNGCRSSSAASRLAALRRAASRGDGWFGTIAGGRMEPGHLREVVATLRAEAAAAGKDPHGLDVTLRVAARAGDVFTPAFEEYLRDLVKSGATRLTFDLGWRSASRSDEILHRLRELSDAF
ncbi:LLM class flavin-dependent oxidoreductase [Nonomuraea ferruginea]